MTTEFKEIKNDLESMTQEQLKEIQQKVQEKIEAGKKDANFSDEELKDLSDLNNDKIDSDSEKELNSYLKNLDNLEKQIDFLLTLVKIKTEKNIGSKTQVEVAESTASNANSIIDMFRNGANKVKDKINKLRNKSNPEEELKEQLKKQLEENKNDSTKIKELKGIGTSFLEKGDLDSAKNIIKIIEKIQENIPNEFKERTKNVYIDQKLKNIEEIIGNLKNKGSVEKSDILSIRLEIYDITYSRDMTLDQEMVNLYSKDVEQVNDLDEAIAMLNYTNRNYAELDGKWVRIGENSLGSVDNQEEILTLQNKLIEKIYQLLADKNEKNPEIEYSFEMDVFNESKGYSGKITKKERKNKTEEKKEVSQASTDGKGELIEEKASIMELAREERKRKISEIARSNVQKLKDDAEKELQANIAIFSVMFINEIHLKSYVDIFNKVYPTLDKLQGTNVSRFEKISQISPIKLDLVNAPILDDILKNDKIKVDFDSIKDLDLKEVFLERVNLELLFKKLKPEQKKIFLSKLNSFIFTRKDDYFQKTGFENIKFLKKQKDIFFILKEENLNGLRNLLDDNYQKETEYINKSFEEKISNGINDETIINNQEEALDYIFKNINLQNNKKINEVYKKFVELIGNGSIKNEKIIKKLINGPKNLEAVKILFGAKDKIQRYYDNLSDLVSNLPDKHDRENADYVDFIINDSEINFIEENNKLSDFFDLYREIDVSLKILAKLKTKYKIEKSILNSGLLKEDELGKIYILGIKHIRHTNLEGLNNSEKLILEEFEGAFKKFEINKKVEKISKEYNEKKETEDNFEEKFQKDLVERLEITEGLAKKIIEILGEESNVEKKIENILSILQIKGVTEEQLGDKIKIISEIIEKYNEKQITQTEKELDKQGVSEEKRKEFLSIEEKAKQQTENWDTLTEKEQQAIITRLENEFVEENFKLKSKEEKDEILKELRKLKKHKKIEQKVKIIQENKETYVKYFHSGYEGSFESFAIENKIPLKNEKGEIINAKEIGISTNYIYKEGIIISNSSGVRIDTKKGTMKDINGNEIKLSQNEINLIKKNEEVAESIINLYQSLEKVGLSKLWNIRESIFRGIENTLGVQFKRNDGDYLSEREIKIFFNSILTSVGEKSIKKELSLDNFLHKIELINGRQITGNEKQVNAYGDSKIEALFIEKFVPRGDLLGFKQIEFEKEIKTGD
ncbi:hypothetical protein DLH72_03955 [Candidatus Gracilibacteria bacterium]|nr:MAG: hypothetical protein DLH72_03955 [Candidatus Gracilibacteria bacterium]